MNKTSYTYAPGGYGEHSTTTLIDSISTGNHSFTYDYNNSGNIETTTENGQTIIYHYNELNELVREDNEVLNKTIVYAYDVGGNILSKTEYPYTIGTLGIATKTINYNYTDANWKVKLTSYDGKEITYDEIGNPLTYDNYTYSWEAGNQLGGISGNGITTSFKYNDSGIRTEKTVNGVTTTYRLEGSRVTYETNGTDEIYYTYDDTLISMNLNGEEYFYVYNLQGDVVGLLDSSGQEVVTYQYDTWGNQVSITGTKASTVGAKNPYRYRGYRYDSETKLYYLNARYYNSEWGRFLNADTFRGLTGDLLSHNAFAYAKNNPVMYVDPTGYFWKSIIKVTKKVVTKTAKVLILDDLQTLTDGKWDGNDVIAAVNLTPWGKVVKGANLAIKAGKNIDGLVASGVRGSKGNSNAVPLKQGGGSNPNDFVTPMQKNICMTLVYHQHQKGLNMERM
ncbi:RHS repeat-associated core domain-containing protein [Lottiidibacillus patelloidae]|uniref:RHS repeat-associated core domain-containing protein n=1 Tax=Lottiidibacillus patelloidae TaxID=2670334 RepID=UPI0018E9E193|nr:RHS repeat-associated core domain-containing protein [Lottiidibacillus patelloidae]